MLQRLYDSIENVRTEPYAKHGTLIRARTKIRKNIKSNDVNRDENY